MKKELKALLNSFLKEKVTVLSWGITNICILDSSLRFDVCGLKYKGNVFICLDTQGYTITLDTKTFSTSLENVILFLDEEIEKTDNYISDLLKEIQS